MSGDTTPIKFVIGSRKLFAVRRRLKTVGCGLEQLLAGTAPDFDAGGVAVDGYRVLSVTEAVRIEALRRFPQHAAGGLQRYRRHYIDMAEGFADYWARFSSKTRSTLQRKRRKLAELMDGALAVEEFRSPDDVGRFFAEAIPLSRRTYQARLLEAGLPEGDAARATAMQLAAENRLRTFLLRARGRAIAYLYLPVEGATLKYAFLGYDPEFSRYSPGTVLQLGALERLFAEERYRYFDFTEGEGAHKALFGTNSIEACSFFLLRGTLPNRCVLRSLDLLDNTVARAKKVATRTGGLGRAHRLLRL
jgi:CelD/BcsL family acetyltransferase involved in cellulose biosynthesis